MMKRTNAFPKSQKLCSKYLIDRLFDQGNNKSVSAYPLRLVYRIEEGAGETQLIISVPKRYFKHAVDRNRVKRLVREAYRTDRDTLRLPDGTHALIAVLWLDSHHRSQKTVAAKLHTLLNKLSEGCKPNEDSKICEDCVSSEGGMSGERVGLSEDSKPNEACMSNEDYKAED